MDESYSRSKDRRSLAWVTGYADAKVGCSLEQARDRANDLFKSTKAQEKYFEGRYAYLESLQCNRNMEGN